MSLYIDFHTHLPPVNGIFNVVVGKTNAPSGQLFSIGIHPWYVRRDTMDDQLEALKKESIHPFCVAIGECGLDKRCQTPFEVQTEAFEHQIELAYQQKKPLIIHCVKAHNELMAIKKHYPFDLPWVLHGFNQSVDIARQLLDLGFYFSLGKALLHPTSNAHQLLALLPLDRLFLETDEGEIGIERIYQAASTTLHLAETDLVRNLQANFNRIITLPA